MGCAGSKEKPAGKKADGVVPTNPLAEHGHKLDDVPVGKAENKFDVPEHVDNPQATSHGKETLKKGDGLLKRANSTLDQDKVAENLKNVHDAAQLPGALETPRVERDENGEVMKPAEKKKANTGSVSLDIRASAQMQFQRNSFKGKPGESENHNEKEGGAAFDVVF